MTWSVPQHGVSVHKCITPTHNYSTLTFGNSGSKNIDIHNAIFSSI